MAAPPSLPEPRSIDRWILAIGMFAARALSMARRSAKFMSGSAPLFAAKAIALASFVKIAPRLASFTPFWRLIVAHLECPDIPIYLVFYLTIFVTTIVPFIQLQR